MDSVVPLLTFIVQLNYYQNYVSTVWLDYVYCRFLLYSVAILTPEEKEATGGFDAILNKTVHRSMILPSPKYGLKVLKKKYKESKK